MSVPIHNLYEFIHQVTEREFILKYFYPWGSKDLNDVIDLVDSDGVYNTKLYTGKQLDYLHQEINKNHAIVRFHPVLFCHDQEPLNFNLYSDCSVPSSLLDTWKKSDKVDHTNQNLRHVMPLSYRQFWILLHSELNSKELKLYEDTQMFKGAYWWSHAAISRDWYRFAQYDNRLTQKNMSHLFLMYCRDTSGSREYRKQFIDLCNHKQLTDNIYTGNTNDSNASAIYDWKDIVNTGIHVILETVFDERIHLTEKTLRPIACGQPFILANGPGSLQYLKSYGFKTFSPWINENYDKEIDDKKRLTAIINEMNRLANLPKSELDYIIKGCNKIAEHNKKVFFSDRFMQQITDELRENVNQAYLFDKNTLDWKRLWKKHNSGKLHGKNKKWKARRAYIIHLIKHLKKGGTLENYVPPDLD